MSQKSLKTKRFGLYKGTKRDGYSVTEPQKYHSYEGSNAVPAPPSGKGNLAQSKTLGIEVGKVMESESYPVCNTENKSEAVCNDT
jgi:hypothetical protein